METDRLDPVDRSRAWEPSDCNWPEFRQQTTSGLDKGDILMITPTRWQFKKKKTSLVQFFFFTEKSWRIEQSESCCGCCLLLLLLLHGRCCRRVIRSGRPVAIGRLGVSVRGRIHGSTTTYKKREKNWCQMIRHSADRWGYLVQWTLAMIGRL